MGGGITHIAQLLTWCIEQPLPTRTALPRFADPRDPTPVNGTTEEIGSAPAGGATVTAGPPNVLNHIIPLQVPELLWWLRVLIAWCRCDDYGATLVVVAL